MNYPGKLLAPFIIAILLFVFIPQLSVFAEEFNLPALENRLAEAKSDTAKANALIKLGEAHCSKENDKALMYLQEAFTIATSEDYAAGIGKSLLWQGRVYYYKDDYPLAIKYLAKSSVYFERTNDLNSLAFVNFAEGEIHRIKGDYLHALDSYRAALKLAEKTGNKKFISTYYGSLGGVHLDRNEPEKAMTYFKKALEEKNAIGDQQGKSNILTYIGMSYEKLDDLDSSLWYHNQALQIRKSLNNKRAIAGSEYNKGGILIKMQAYEEAEKSLFVALENFTILEEKTGIIITNLRLATALNKLNKPDAIKRANRALEMATNIDNPNLISHACKILSDIYFANKNYAASHEFLEKHMTLEDSLFNIEKERIITEFEEKFQSDRKDREIKYYRTKNKVQKQNNILLVFLLVASTGIVILLIFLFRLKSTAFNKQKKLMEQEHLIHDQQNKIAEKEKQLLQEQLESKNRELASKALEMLRYNDAITSIINKMESLNNSLDHHPEAEKPIKDIIHELENHNKQNIWNEFEKIFKNIHSGFYDKLLETCPELTATEIKTAALLKLNLTTKEIAAITFKSEGGIKTTRYRLRKKLGLSGDDNLVPFLMQI